MNMDMFGGPLNRKRRKPPAPYWVKYIPRQEQQQQALEEQLNKSLGDVGFSVKTVNILENAGIFTIRDFIKQSENRLKELNSIGDITLKECADRLTDLSIPWTHRHAD